MKDLVDAVVLLLLLAIPFAFALERLLRSDDIAWDEGSIASVTTAALAGL